MFDACSGSLGAPDAVVGHCRAYCSHAQRCETMRHRSCMGIALASHRASWRVRGGTACASSDAATIHELLFFTRASIALCFFVCENRSKMHFPSSARSTGPCLPKNRSMRHHSRAVLKTGRETGWISCFDSLESIASRRRWQVKSHPNQKSNGKQ